MYVRITNKYYIFWVCDCSRTYPACNAHAPYSHEFEEYSQQDATFNHLSISVRRSTCFIRVFLPSSGAQNCTYSFRYLSDCNDL